MDKSNVVLTIPEAGKVELVERPYPTVKPGYLLIKVEIAPICLEGTRVYNSYGQECHDNPKQGKGHEGVGVVDFAHPDLVFKAGDWMLVGGIGFIGMGHVISAHYRGANVIALMRNEYREEMLKRMGVEHFVDPKDDDWLEGGWGC